MGVPSCQAMNIHEFQAKGLFRDYGIPVPEGVPCHSVDEVGAAYQQLCQDTGGRVVVVRDGAEYFC